MIRIVARTKHLASRHLLRKEARALSCSTSTITRSNPKSLGSTNMGMHKNMPFSSQAHEGDQVSKHKFLDEKNLLTFNTIHELQAHASAVFADNPLFGTYTEHEKDGGGDGKAEFEWMSYKEYDEKVTLCRSVLKDLGEYSTHA